MNEFLLINMMGELSPELLQNNYIEKDMNIEQGPILGRIASFKKMFHKHYDYVLGKSLSEEIANQNIQLNNEEEVGEEIDKVEIMSDADELENDDLNQNNQGISISIFKKNIHSLIKIISGITATFLVVVGIIIFIIRHHKSGMKTTDKGIQVFY